MSNNVLSEQSDLVYRHFLCCVAYLVFCILFVFYGMLNVGCYFIIIFFILLPYSRELAHELLTCVYVHHCA